MKSVALTAFPRTQLRRGEVKKLRTTGRVPASIYGGQTQPQNLEIDMEELEDLIHHSASENVLVDLAVENDRKRLALVQEVQHHPLSGKVLHVDLHEVAEDEKVTIMVPVESSGEAVGVKTGGGVLEHVLFKIKVRALPKDLPDVITIDVSKLEIGQSIHVGDIQAADGVEILGDKHISVMAVAAPLTEAQELAAAAAAGTPAEVEMTKEKKEDGTEGAAPAKAGEKAAAAPKAGDKAAAPKAEEKKPAEKKK
ncbi:MAG: 50S ribosomal protein L25 [Verrucomicrobiota bacterium]